MKDETKRSAVSADGFIKYRLIDKEDVSSTCSIFTLEPATSTAIDLGDPSLARAITSVQFKQPQLQIARSYTLLPTLDRQDATQLRFLIRKEQKGEVSGYLHKLPVGGEIEVRGPSADYVLPQDVGAVVFLAGGTGIAPALQVATKVSSDADVHILWANRRREDCIGGVSATQASNTTNWSLWNWWQPSVTTAKQNEIDTLSAEGAMVTHMEYLEGLRQQANATQLAKGLLSVDYFVDEERTFISPATLQKIVKSTASKGFETRKLLFVSGPEGFVSHWAGPKQWANGREIQGPLDGVLSRLDLEGWEVVKL